MNALGRHAVPPGRIFEARDKTGLRSAYYPHTSATKLNGGGYGLCFTAALRNGWDIYAFRYAVNDSANTLYYQQPA